MTNVKVIARFGMSRCPGVQWAALMAVWCLAVAAHSPTAHQGPKAAAEGPAASGILHRIEAEVQSGFAAERKDVGAVLATQLRSAQAARGKMAHELHLCQRRLHAEGQRLPFPSDVKRLLSPRGPGGHTDSEDTPLDFLRPTLATPARSLISAHAGGASFRQTSTAT